jgi:prephenate dehydrogenase (NADP+)
MNERILRLRQSKVEIMQSGHLVSRCSDFIIYSVEAKNIDAVVKTFGPCTPSPDIDTCYH